MCIVVICPPKSQLGLMLYILGCKENMAELQDSADENPTRTPNPAPNADPVSPVNPIADVDLASPPEAVADALPASSPKAAADALPASPPNCATKSISAAEVEEMIKAGLVCGCGLEH